MTGERPNNFTVELTMKDAILENLAKVTFSDWRVTNFSKDLGAYNRMLSSQEWWGEEIYTWGQKLPEKIKLRSKNWTYNGYAWGMTDENGYLYIQRERVDLTLTVEGSNMKRIIVYGDRTANQWATEAYLDGDPDNKIYSDDGVWAIQWAFPSNTHSVTFTRWNRAKYPACIIHVRRFGDTMYCGIVTTKRWEWLTQITPRPKEIYYGVTPGRGEVVLWARHELKDYIEDGILTSDMLSVRIKNNDETVVVRSVSDSEYDMSSKLLTLELSDCLSSWGKRKYPGRGLTEEMSAFDLMAEVLSGLKYTVNDVERMCVKTIPVGTEGDEMTVAEYLKAIMIPYPYLEPDTYRATIEKFCRLAQICCYADDNNFPVFVSGRPVMLKAERERPIYDIPKSHQFGPVRKSVIKKNKVKRVEVEVNDVNVVFGQITEEANLLIYENKDKEGNKDNYVSVVLNNEINPVEEYHLQVEDYMLGNNKVKKLSGKARLYTNQRFYSNSISSYYKDNVVYVNTDTSAIDGSYNNENANSSKIFQNIIATDDYIDFDFLIDMIYKDSEISLKQKRYMLNASLYFKGRYIKVTKKTKSY